MRSRRNFLKTLTQATASFTVLADPLVELLAETLDIERSEAAALFQHECMLQRPSDHLHLKLFFSNLAPQNSRLVRGKANTDAFIVVRIPQQHIAERYVNIVNDTTTPPPSTTHESLISGFSYLSFRFRPSDALPAYHAEALLDWRGFRLCTLADVLNSEAFPVSLNGRYPLKDRFPDEFHVSPAERAPLSFFEVPYKILLSPVASELRPEPQATYEYKFTGNNTLKHLYTSKDSQKQIELSEIWNNDLKILKSSPLTGRSWLPPSFKIIGYNSADDPFELLPEPGHREKLGKLTQLKEPGRDVKADYFNISAFGTSTYLRYDHPEPYGHEIVNWKQEIKYGRDNYANVTTRGIDVRTGLRVLISEITERRVEKGISFLLKRYHFKYLDKIKEFTDERLYNNIWCRSIRPLSEGSFYKEVKLGTARDKVAGIIPYVELEPKILKMPYAIEDKAGNVIKLPDGLDLMFLQESEFDETTVNKALEVYDREYLSNKSRIKDHLIRLDKQKIAYAPPAASGGSITVENTVLETDDFQLYSVYGGKFDSPDPIIPQLKFASVYIPQLDGIEKVPTPRKVAYSRSFSEQGFGKGNPAGIFLQTLSEDIITTPLKGYQDEKSMGGPRNSVLEKSAPIKDVFTESYKNIGSMINPDIVIENLSRKEQGLTFSEELNQRAGNTAGTIEVVSPAEILKGLNAEILGGISLKMILRQILPLEDTPVFRAVNDAEEALRTLGTYKAEYLRRLEAVKTAAREIEGIRDDLQNLGTRGKEILENVNKYFEALNEDFRLSISQKFQSELTAIQSRVTSAIRTHTDSYLTPLNDFFKTTGEYIRYTAASAQVVQLFDRLIASAPSHSVVLTEMKYEAILFFEEATKKYTPELIRNWPSALSMTESSALIFREAIRNQLGRIKSTKLSLPATLFGNRTLPAQVAPELRDILMQSGQSWVLVLNDDLSGWESFLQNNRKDLEARSEAFAKIYFETLQEYHPYSGNFLARKKAETETWLQQIVPAFSDAVKAALTKTSAYVELSQYYHHHLFIFREFERIFDRLSILVSRNFISVPKDEADAIAAEVRSAQDRARAAMLTELRSVASRIPDQSVRADVTGLIEKLKTTDFRNPALLEAAFQPLKNRIQVEYDRIFREADRARQVLQEALGQKEEQLKKLEAEVRDFFENTLAAIKSEYEVALSDLNQSYQQGEAQAQAALQKFNQIKDTYDRIMSATTRKLDYTWKTSALEDRNFGLVRFSRNERAEPRLEVNISTVLNYEFAFPPRLSKIETYSKSSLTNFTLTFFNILSVVFDRIDFSSGSGQKEKFDVTIQSVGFNGPLDFVEVFQEYLQTVDKALNLEMDSSGVSLTYGIPLPDITGGSFNFAFARLTMGLKLPFVPKVPMQFIFGINTPQDMFLISAGIFGGRGCFQIGLEPKRGIVYILLVIEFGGVLLLNIRFAAGMVYLFAGIYYRKEHDTVQLRGYVVCGGVLNIKNIVTASVVFNMGLRGTGNYAEGYCTVYYKIEVTRFISYKVGLTLYKRIYGTAKDRDSAEKLDWATDRLLGPERSPENNDPQFDMTDQEWLQFFQSYKHV